MDQGELLLTSAGRILSKSYSYANSFNSTFGLSSFNVETCSMSQAQPIGSDNLNSADRLLFADSFAQDIHSILYEDTLTGTLKMSVFRNSLSGKVLSIASVAPAVKLLKAQSFAHQSGVFVLLLDQVGLRANFSSIAWK
jgi:hypothetical protein